MCIDKANPCVNEGEYFIADFVFIKKKTNAFNQIEWDVIIADTKLSESTSFTNNQKRAMKMDSYSVKSIRQPSIDIKGSSISIRVGDKVVRNVIKNSSIKIYSYGNGVYKNSNTADK